MAGFTTLTIPEGVAIDAGVQITQLSARLPRCSACPTLPVLLYLCAGFAMWSTGVWAFT